MVDTSLFSCIAYMEPDLRLLARASRISVHRRQGAGGWLEVAAVDVELAVVTFLGRHPSGAPSTYVALAGKMCVSVEWSGKSLRAGPAVLVDSKFADESFDGADTYGPPRRVDRNGVLSPFGRTHGLGGSLDTAISFNGCVVGTRAIDLDVDEPRFELVQVQHNQPVEDAPLFADHDWPPTAGSVCLAASADEEMLAWVSVSEATERLSFAVWSSSGHPLVDVTLPRVWWARQLRSVPAPVPVGDGFAFVVDLPPAANNELDVHSWSPGTGLRTIQVAYEGVLSGYCAGESEVTLVDRDGRLSSVIVPAVS